MRLLGREGAKGPCRGAPWQYRINSVQLSFTAITFINSSDTLKIFDRMSCDEGRVRVLVKA